MCGQIVQYEPIGVCAGISAWNGTAIAFGWKVAPAVAAGCTIVFKSSEKSPLGVGWCFRFGGRSGADFLV